MKKGFTLVELLVVLGVLAILAVIVVLILDPAKIFAQARDARRIEDLRTVGSALRLGGLADINFGEEETVYVSLPDDESVSCEHLHLPELESPFHYQCTPQETLFEADGNGWIPVDFSGLEDVGISLSALPLDPKNVLEGGSYYTYSIFDKKWKLTARVESDRYESISASDGGIDDVLFEVASVSKVEPSLDR